MKQFLVIVLLIFISGCVFGPLKELKYQIEDSWESDPQKEPPTELFDIVNSNGLSLLWNAQAGTESLWEIDKKSHEIHTLDMFIYEGFLFTLNHDGVIKKFDVSSGVMVWEKDFNFEVSAGISGDSDYLYFVSSEGDLWCLDHNGKELWKTYVGGQVFVSPLPNTNFVTVKLNFNEFVQLRSVNGSIAWRYQAPNPPLTIKSQGKMSFANKAIYSGLPGGKLIAIEAKTGLMVWEVSVDQSKGVTEIDRANDVTSQPIIDGPIIYSVSSKGKIAAFDRRSSQMLWDRPLSSFVGINLYGNDIIVTHESSSIYSLQNEAGQTNWRNADLQYRNIGRGVVVDRFIATGDYDGYLHFVSLSDGKIANRIQLSDSQILDNIISLNNNKIIVMDANGNIYCLDINIL
jgi:outer membrane protein assembly factor BamB